MSSCYLIFYQDCQTSKMIKSGFNYKRVLSSFCTVLSRMYLKSKDPKPCKSESMLLKTVSTRPCSIDFIWSQNNKKESKQRRMNSKKKSKFQLTSRNWLQMMITSSKSSKRKVSVTEQTVHQIKSGTSLDNKKLEKKSILKSSAF